MNCKRCAVFALVGVVAATAIAYAGQPPADDMQAITRVEHGLLTPVVIAGEPPHATTLQSRMQHYHISAVSIAFFDASGIRWARAYGAATDTLFQAGSVSKSVSAVGIMRLVQEGRLNLDENVNNVLRGWKVPDTPLTAKQPVTLRELLSHTAGTTVHGFWGYERGKTLPTIDQVLDGSPPANSAPIRVDLQPGAQYSYSGGGYLIAEKLLLDTVHQPFAAYMQERVLKPLGMTNSTFEQPLPQSMWSRAATATDSTGRPYPGGWNVYPEQSAAGLWTTPSDLARFAIGVQQSLDGDPNALLSKATAREMLTPVKDHYALGFAVTGGGRTGTFGHEGANIGFQAAFVMHRGAQGVAIMTNSDNGSDLIGELMASVATAYGWADYVPKQKKLYPISPEALSRFVGGYDFGNDAIEVVRKGTALYLVDASGEDRLYPESPMTFFILDRDLDIGFVSDSSGAVTRLSLLQDGAIAKKLPPFPPVIALDSPTLSSYQGSYESDGTAIDVRVERGHVFAKRGGHPSFEIYPSSRDQFYGKLVNLQIVFARSASGAVTTLRLYQNGKSVTFSRSP